MSQHPLQRLRAEEGGQDLVEWAFLAAFIAIVATLVLAEFRNPILGIYQTVLDHLHLMSNNLLPIP